jgi:hypothetical protein
MKKILKIIGILVVLIVIVVSIFIFTYQPKQYSDFGIFTSLRTYVITTLKDYNATERSITQEFSEFTLAISFPFNKVFGSDVIAVPLQSFESDMLGVATISQFEVPPDSSYYRDFTLHIRPQYGLRAPVFHIDFMKPAPGTPGMCSMDFFNPNKDNIPLKEFFGEELENIQKALTLVERYQRSVEEGRGKITKYLDPYKSEYRCELLEPQTEDETLREKYYTTVAEAFKLFFHAYLIGLHKLERDTGYAQTHEEKTRDLVRLFYENDFAVSLGKRVFKEHFKKYWLDGFWNVQIALED